MRIGIDSYCLLPLGLTPLDTLKWAKKNGAQGVQFSGLREEEIPLVDKAYLKELKSRTNGEGIRNVLIMCDGEGALGAVKKEDRKKTVANHKKWVEAAKYLGCHSIRVNAAGQGSREEQAKQVTDWQIEVGT